jgi:predicted XRE-type DNA-binding protein
MSNVFLEHGFSAEDATVLALKSDVAAAIRTAVAEAKQKDIGRRLGIAQSDVSKIIRGDLAAISLERLIKITVRLKLEMCAEWSANPHAANAVRAPQTIVTATRVVKFADHPTTYGDMRASDDRQGDSNVSP